MTIPQQACVEVNTPVCHTVSKQQCSLVPKETCVQPEEAEETPTCRTNTRLECEDRPRQQCGNTVVLVTLSHNNSVTLVTLVTKQLWWDL